MEEEVGKEKEGDKENPNNSNDDNHKSQEIPKKAKSCKGCLYYSSTLKSNSRAPRCVGITRSLPQVLCLLNRFNSCTIFLLVPRYIVGESEMEASREGRSLAYFKYGCVGYSVYSDGKGPSPDVQETQTEMPVCVGLEVLVDKRVNSADSVPAHVHNREDAHVPQPRAQKPAHSVGDEFLSRFSRNASVVGMGVAKNLRRVGNHVKERLDDILYPYRRRPK